MSSKNISVAARNISALRSLSTMAPRGLEMAQERHPDHRTYSSEGNPFPCPANGIMRSYTDIDFRNTKPKDLPVNMKAPRRNNRYKDVVRAPLGRSKWDFAYMKSGESMAVRVGYLKDHDLYDSEFQRISKIGKAMYYYQKKKGYIDSGFLIQTSEEMISVGKLSNGDDVLAPHVVFWRIDGTHLDPQYQGN